MNPSVWTAIKPIAAQAARDFLRTVGTYLAAKGLIQGDAGVATFIGAGLALAGLFWGWFTTSGYLQLADLLKKLTATHTPAAAVEVAKVMPAAVDTGAANNAKAIVSAAGVVKILLFAFLLSAFLVPSAFAQAPKLTGNIARDIAAARAPSTAAPATAGVVDNALTDFSGQIQKITKDIVDKAISDVTAAQTDAQNHNDQISKPCWDANLALLKSLPTQWENPPTFPVGLALGIQIQRDLLNSITGNDAGSLKVACAALWGDQLKIVANLGALIGVKIATGGLL